MKNLFYFFLWLSLVGNSYSKSVTWYKIFQHTSSSILYKSHQTNDGGYITVGIDRIGIDYKMIFAKVNQYGDSVWSKYYDLNIKANYRGFWIENTYDKGFIISGSGDGPNTDAYLVKLDSLGNIKWTKIFSTPDLDQGRCVKELPDRGFILLTRIASFPYNHIVLTRTDSAGKSLWSKSYGNFDIGTEVDFIENSGFIVSGYRFDGDTSKLYMLRTDLNGDTLWTKMYKEFHHAGAYSIDITQDNGFIIGGGVDTITNFTNRSLVVKFDSLGNIQWHKIYANGFNEICYSIKKFSNTGYVFCGYSDSLEFINQRGLVRRIDLSGNVLYEKYLTVGGIENRFYSVELTNDNGLILSGNCSTFNNTFGLLVKTDSTGNIYPVGINNSNLILQDFELQQNYPNPFNPITSISYYLPNKGEVSLIVYDIQGKEIITLANEKQSAGSHSVQFDGSNLSSGIYFYKLRVGQFEETKKMVLIK